MISLETYLDTLIPPPNKIMPNFMDWVEAHFKVPVDSQAMFDTFTEEFDIDTAVGPQLDVIGELLALSRQLRYQPGGGLSSYISDDEIYRLMLKARIIMTVWKGTKQEIYDFWNTFLPDYPILIQDNQDMTMSVLIIGMPNDLTGTKTFAYGDTSGDPLLGGYGAGYWEGFDGLMRGLVKNGYFCPKPAGVLINYSFQDDPIFSYGVDSAYLKGYGAGSWVSFI